MKKSRLNQETDMQFTSKNSPKQEFDNFFIGENKIMDLLTHILVII